MNGPHRLLFVLYEAAFGGVERQAELLAEAAHAAGHRVELLVLGTGGPALPRFAASCETVRVLNVDRRNDLRLWWHLRAAVGSSPRYDAAFVFSLAKFAVLSNALRGAAPRQALHVGNPVGPSLEERAKQQLRAYVFPISPGLHLVANSQHTLRSLADHPFYRRFALHVSLNCVRIADSPIELRESCRPLRIGMVARLDPIKDHATLIHAVSRLQQAGVPIECELLGGGPRERELKELSEKLALGQAVKFRGFTDSVASTVSQWDVFVFSVTEREGFGNAVAEAMAQGLPCIVTDIGPCREVGADTTEYVPPRSPEVLADRIAQLGGDFSRRKQLGASAYQRASTCFRAPRKLAEFLSIADTSVGR